MPIRPSSPRRSTSEPVVLAIEVVNVNDRHPGAGCTRGTNFPPPGCVELSIPVAKTLAQKLWDAHVVRSTEGEPDLLFVDLHLVHEVTSPQAFDGLAFGIGTSEVELVLATQCLPQKRQGDLAVDVTGVLPLGVTAKDIVLGVIGRTGTSAGQGHLVEYRGATIEGLSMEGRMTICNMSIEWGAKAGMVGPDDTTFSYVEGKPHAPRGAAWESAVDYWRSLPTDDGAKFDGTIEIDASKLEPHVTWGTTPAQVVPVTGRVPSPRSETDERALRYMDLLPGTALADIAIDRVFIGSCTNARLEDLRAAAGVIHGRRVHPKVRAMVVPGSTSVKRAAEEEGLDLVFKAAGFEWRNAGCSMCLGMNPDILAPGERCASTSNRNFEGRQGSGGRTHLMSPPMAAAAALTGHLVDVREMM